MTEFRNESGHTFTDISSEQYRIYTFPNREFVRIDEPLKLSVASSGGHRIFDASGHSHYIPKGWLQITWAAKEGQPHFVK